MANLMPEVAKLLGVETGEPFYILQNGKHRRIYSDNDLYKITEEGLANINNTDGCYEYHSHCRVILTDLLLGKCSVEKLPCEPKYEEQFYTYIHNEAHNEWLVEWFYWYGDPAQLALKQLGMVFKTQEEAEKALPEFYKMLTGKPLKVQNNE